MVDLERYGWDDTPTPDMGLDDSKAPQVIQELAKYVIEKRKGKQVASAYSQAMIASGIIALAAEALAKQVESNNAEMEVFLNEMLLEMTNKDIISAPEIIESRDGESRLSIRLDRDMQTFETGISNLANIRNVTNYGVTNDDVDTEDALNLLPGGYTYLFPPGKYRVRGFNSFSNEEGFKLKDNTTYIFLEGAELTITPNANPQYSMILINDTKNFKLINPVLVGDREDHDFSGGGTHERGAGIMIRGAATGTIIRPRVSKTSGDGIDIICGLGSDIVIEYPVIKNARRNGISIESVDKLLINYPEVSGTQGTAPEAGIDIEPFASYHILNDVRINNANVYNNAKYGIAMSGHNDGHNIILQDCSMDGLFFGVMFSTNDTRNIIINNPVISGGIMGIVLVDASPSVEINNPIISISEVSPEYPGPIVLEKTRYVQRSVGSVTIRGAVLRNPNNLSGVYPITLDIRKGDINTDTFWNYMPNVKINIKENEFKGLGVNTFNATPQIVMVNSLIDMIPNSDQAITHNMIANSDYFYNQVITNTGASTDLFHNIGNGTALRMTGSRITFLVTQPSKVSVFLSAGILPYGVTALSSSQVGARLTLEVQTIGASNRIVVVERIGDWV